ncbi:MAG TPA: YihY/virulence factor BrkB family protein [Saprospiraceae bacterium]|nr:YihY/virulence factor BrkB family protein [Candidatus Parvibacillus calidus]MBX2937492.1 YihY/virulence factor BrkB family protein [Saprospiraceae bacterium]MBX7178017.1 YihY/virulence factor BrkB family protein [Saprospiraceae bacterium]MCB0590874.1 YihY/virulence factor BrkB family protein [Saprospiraceae bacterium]MCO5284325.1 YihY/virulence factor BrkB family protein [Saprospiraceae bacterium]
MFNRKSDSRLAAFMREQTVYFELIDWSRIHTLPGLRGQSIYRIFSELGVHLKRSNIALKASAISFSFMVASFPFMIFLLTLLPYFHIQNAVDVLKSNIGNLLPTNVENTLFGLIEDTIKPRGSLLSIGFISALFFASNGVLNLMSAFDQSERAKTLEINWVKKRMKAILLTILLFLLLVVTIIAFVLANQILQIIGLYINIDYITRGLILAARWVPVFFLMYGLLTLIYRLGPSIKRKIPFFTIGTYMTTFLCILVSLLISYFVNNFSNYNKIYGSLGTIAALMLWLQTNMILIFVGYELNLIINEFPRRKRSKAS